MWLFYAGTVKEVPGILRRGVGLVVTGITVAIFLAWLFNPDWGKWLNARWPDLPRWWAFASLGLLFLYGLLKANYKKFQSLGVEQDAERSGRVQAEKERDYERSDRQRLLAENETLKQGQAKQQGPIGFDLRGATDVTMHRIGFTGMGKGTGIHAPGIRDLTVEDMQFSGGSLPPSDSAPGLHPEVEKFIDPKTCAQCGQRMGLHPKPDYSPCPPKPPQAPHKEK